MTERVEPNPLHQLAVGIAGAGALGACLALRAGLVEALSSGAALATIVVGLAAVMCPALYIGAAFVGVAPPGRAVARASARAVRDSGLVMLGLTPAVAFLVATMQRAETSVLLGYLVLTLALGLALHSLYRNLFDGASQHTRAGALFGTWALVSLGIGERLFASTMGVS